ncbi:T9SS type A sorting domain-containing protein [Catalinimonas sp. 4WD22]|uniref:T9SS type A sorting domain-containing protein n=1 Tax=Catalinimonas locisalis TaxID=3133978 RepID=UPI003100DA33
MPTTLSNPIPVELIYFSGYYQNKSVFLEWATASETNNSHFEIERAVDGFEFEKIGEVQGADNSTRKIEYVFEDQQLSSRMGSIFYYRLRQEDYDGQYEYSKSIAVFNETSGVLNLWPTPFTDHINILINSMASESLEIIIYDVNGNTFALNDFEILKGKNTLEVNDLGRLPKGIYFLNMGSKNLQYKRKLIKY